MTTKWTKGPWTAKKGNYDPPEYEIYGQSAWDAPQIATVFGELHGGELPAEANAQLIASAPDLAERLELTNQQLKHAMDALQGGGGHESTWQNLCDCLYENERALLKARGEQ